MKVICLLAMIILATFTSTKDTLTQENTKMRPLPKEFEGKGEVKGYTFRQLIKQPHGYIYEVDGCRYEVFKHKENTRFNLVRYPRSNHFGKWAHSTPSFKRAVEILDKWKN